MDYTDLNALATRVHQANIKWWQHPVTKERIERNKGELLMLVITELAEACEGERKNLMDDKLPHREMAEVEMADAVIRLLDFAAGFHLRLCSIHDRFRLKAIKNANSVGEYLLLLCKDVIKVYDRIIEEQDFAGINISNLIMCIEEYCKIRQYDLWSAFEEKMTYNATREDHTHEARLLADGKKW